MKSLLNDVTFGLRTLIKNPGFTIVAVLSLGLGIGAVTSVYSMISAVLLTPLPFDEADRLYSLYTISERDRELRDSCSYPEYMEWQKQSKSFESIAAYSNGSYNLTSGDEPVRVECGLISQASFRRCALPWRSDGT